jgi:hypothetical protein
MFVFETDLSNLAEALSKRSKRALVPSGKGLLWYVCHACKPATYFANDLEEIFSLFEDTVFLPAQIQKFSKAD